MRTITSTLYVLLSFLHYWLDAYPSYRHFKEQPEYVKFHSEQLWGKKGLRRFFKAGFYLATANFAVCCCVLLLKIAGVIEWW